MQQQHCHTAAATEHPLHFLRLHRIHQCQQLRSVHLHLLLLLLLLVQVLELLLERKAAETRHTRELSLRDAELGRLQQYIDDELMELHTRQAQVSTSHCSSKIHWQQQLSTAEGVPCIALPFCDLQQLQQ
jgi:hypothetical protein